MCVNVCICECRVIADVYVYIQACILLFPFSNVKLPIIKGGRWWWVDASQIVTYYIQNLLVDLSFWTSACKLHDTWNSVHIIDICIRNFCPKLLMYLSLWSLTSKVYETSEHFILVIDRCIRQVEHQSSKTKADCIFLTQNAVLSSLLKSKCCTLSKFSDIFVQNAVLSKKQFSEVFCDYWLLTRHPPSHVGNVRETLRTLIFATVQHFGQKTWKKCNSTTFWVQKWRQYGILNQDMCLALVFEHWYTNCMMDLIIFEYWYPNCMMPLTLSEHSNANCMRHLTVFECWHAKYLIHLSPGAPGQIPY